MKINTKNQEGFVLVVVAVLLFALIGFLGGRNVGNKAMSRAGVA